MSHTEDLRCDWRLRSFLDVPMSQAHKGLSEHWGQLQAHPQHWIREATGIKVGKGNTAKGEKQD